MPKIHHDTLMNYMIDGRCEISNNRAERKAKKLCRWAESLPVPYIRSWSWGKCGNVQHCGNSKSKQSEYFPKYLYMVLLYMPDYMNSSAGIEQLMPWSEFIKERCSGIIVWNQIVSENRIPPCHVDSRENLK